MVAHRSLIEAIVSSPRGSVTTVVAPAGYGKSTLLDGLRSSATTATFNVGPQHDDAVRFGRDLLSVLGHDGPAPPIGSNDFARVMLDQLADAAVEIVVLDDLHRIDNPTVAAVLGTMVWENADKRIVIASRRPPPIGMAALKVKRRLFEIGRHQLSLDRAEALALVEAVARRVDLADSVHEQIDRLDGWAAGLVLLGLAAQGGDTNYQMSLQADLDQYVSEELFAGLDHDLAQFILELSVMGVFNEHVVEQVTQRPDARRLLDEVLSRQIMVEPVRGSHDWLKFHDLFKEILARRADRLAPALRAAVQRRLMEHLTSVEDFDRATEVALTVHDPVVLAPMMVVGTGGNFVYSMYVRGEVDNIARIFHNVPVAAHRDDPVALQMGLSGALMVPDCKRAEPFYRALVRLDVLSSPHDATPILGSGLALFDLYTGSIAQSAVHDARASAISARPEWRGSALHYMQASVTAMVLLHTGDLAASLDAAIRALHLADSLRAQSGVAANHAIAGIARLLLGDQSQRADDLAGALDPRFIVTVHEHPYVDAFHGLARASEGDLEGARQVLQSSIARAEFLAQCLPGALPLVLLSHIERRLDRHEAAVGHAIQATRLIERSTGAGLFELLDAHFGGVYSSGQLAGVNDFELTDRERKILRMLDTRLTLREIANEMSLSVNTVKTHTRSIYRKLSVASRSEAAALAAPVLRA